MNYEIGILGAGNVGRVLGTKWAMKGHKVTFGVRSPNKYKEIADENRNISIRTADEVVKTHDLLVLALPGKEVGSILATFDNLTGKLIIDATNMYGMNKLEKQFPQAQFAKAFNTIGYNIMDQPQIKNDKVSLLYCGNDEKLLSITKDLVSDIGLEPFYIGDNTLAPDLENFALLWIKMSRKIGRNFGFKLLH